MSGEKDVVSSRLQYVDNLRVLLTALVILHHAIITYGAPGSWYYIESRPGPVTFPFFALFVVTNQAFFMGMFFMIGGFFTPSSYDRKGAFRFLKDRFLRLGIPIIFYMLFIHPLTLLLLHVSVWNTSGNSIDLVRQYLQGCKEFHVGPLWFTETLLLFGIIYVMYRQITGRGNQNLIISRKPATTEIIIFILVLSLVTFLVRLYFPVGRVIAHFNVQPAHVSQYAILFIAGIVAYRRRWFTDIPLSCSRIWLTVVLFCIVVLFPVLFALGGAMEGNTRPYMGGLYWQALAYALWEQFVGVSMIIALLSLFYNKFNYQGRLLQTLASSCYAVYIIHPVVLVLIAIAIKNVSLHPAVKFFILGTLAIPACFALGCLIRKLPLAKRIL
jgi:glucan biosynthesis protein C